MLKNITHIEYSNSISEESNLVKAYSSKWLIAALKQNIKYSDTFFECIGYCCGSLHDLTKSIISSIIQYNKNRKGNIVSEESIINLKTCPSSLRADTLESLIEDYPFIKNSIRLTISKELDKNIPQKLGLTYKDSPVYQLKKLFVLDEDALEFCYFIFATSEFEVLKEYLRHDLEIFEYEKTGLLSRIIGMDEKKCKELRNKFELMGITHDSHSGPTLTEEVDKSIKGIGDKTLKEILCPPIGKSEILLDEFPLDPDDIKYVVNLLSKKHHHPIHVLLYGPGGVGKSTFARALAKHLKVKAFEVLNGPDKDTDDRKASLCACLNIAKKFENSFTLVDEADSLLDVLTDDYSHGTSSKAWINSMLEDKDNRVIWIVNSTSYIDDSVKRRFAYSIYFKNLTVTQQINMWGKITRKLKVENKVSLEVIKRLVNTYSPPISCIESSIQLAKIAATKHDFVDCVERNLKAYRTLINNGRSTRNPVVDLEDFVMDGICTSIPVSSLLAKVRQMDSNLKSQKNCPPGMLNLIFFGVSGGGKSALSKYIAKELDKPCIIKRGSDLISQWVGSTERNIRQAFEEASDMEGVLVLDEADIFIPNRQVAQNEWDVSMSAEMLTCLEECRSICICTTNFKEYVDNAAIRRFSLKVKFGYALSQHLEALYKKMLAPFVGSDLDQRGLEMLKSFKFLCVGDFSTVRKQVLMGNQQNITHEDLLKALANEEHMKREHGAKRLGFVA